jgi:hypothetical protein
MARLVKRTLSGEIAVDGADFEWRLHREPRWSSGEGLKGLAVAVCLLGGQREAVLEFPFKWGKHKSAPHLQRPPITAAMLEHGIRVALAAGWSPETKGKTQIFSVE